MGRASRKRAEQRRGAPSAAPAPAPGEGTSSNGAPVPTRAPDLQAAPPERQARRAPTRALPPHARTGLLTLEELRQAQRQIEQAIVEQVDELSRLGAGWGVIGRALGVSRQAARQRYGTRTP